MRAMRRFGSREKHLLAARKNSSTKAVARPPHLQHTNPLNTMTQQQLVDQLALDLGITIKSRRPYAREVFKHMAMDLLPRPQTSVGSTFLGLCGLGQKRRVPSSDTHRTLRKPCTGPGSGKCSIANIPTGTNFLKTTPMRTLLLCLTYLLSCYTTAQISIDAFLAKDIEIISATPSAGSLIVGGFDGAGSYVTNTVTMEQGNVLEVGTHQLWPNVSLITIPFKVRAAVDSLSPTVQTGLTNAGLMVNLYGYTLSRYFYNGKQSHHRFGAGLFLAPSAEDISPTTTRGRVTTTTKQLFISAGASVTYTYNDVTFAFVPLGFDFATTTEGQDFIHNKQYWWGFGLGLSLKVFGI